MKNHRFFNENLMVFAKTIGFSMKNFGKRVALLRAPPQLQGETQMIQSSLGKCNIAPCSTPTAGETPRIKSNLGKSHAPSSTPLSGEIPRIKSNLWKCSTAPCSTPAAGEFPRINSNLWKCNAAPCSTQNFGGIPKDQEQTLEV